VSQAGLAGGLSEVGAAWSLQRIPTLEPPATRGGRLRQPERRTVLAQLHSSASEASATPRLRYGFQLPSAAPLVMLLLGWVLHCAAYQVTLSYICSIRLQFVKPTKEQVSTISWVSHCHLLSVYIC